MQFITDAPARESSAEALSGFIDLKNGDLQLGKPYAHNCKDRRFWDYSSGLCKLLRDGNFKE